MAVRATRSSSWWRRSPSRNTPASTQPWLTIIAKTLQLLGSSPKSPLTPWRRFQSIGNFVGSNDPSGVIQGAFVIPFVSDILFDRLNGVLRSMIDRNVRAPNVCPSAASCGLDLHSISDVRAARRLQRRVGPLPASYPPPPHSR